MSQSQSHHPSLPSPSGKFTHWPPCEVSFQTITILLEYYSRVAPVVPCHSVWYHLRCQRPPQICLIAVWWPGGWRFGVVRLAGVPTCEPGKLRTSETPKPLRHALGTVVSWLSGLRLLLSRHHCNDYRRYACIYNIFRIYCCKCRGSY
jgi:hypothetical protein